MNLPLKSFTGLFTAFFQDGPAYWFDFLNINNWTEENAASSFEIPLLISYGSGAPRIQISKQANGYYYVPGKKQLIYTNEIVASQLEEIWQNAKEIQQMGSGGLPIWKSVEATVTEDPEKSGKAYLVQQIQFF